jgi:hypothetical protein
VDRFLVFSVQQHLSRSSLGVSDREFGTQRFKEIIIVNSENRTKKHMYSLCRRSGEVLDSKADNTFSCQ